MKNNHLHIVTDRELIKHIIVGDNESAYESFLVFANNQNTRCKVSIQLQGKNSTGHAHIIAICFSSHNVHIDGEISIEESGDGANAKLSQEIIAIGDSLYTIAKPVLDVRNNNVSASHGAKIHRIDNNQLFYLSSRGLTNEQAINTILRGIIDNLIENASHIYLHDQYGEKIVDKTNDLTIQLMNLVSSKGK